MKRALLLALLMTFAASAWADADPPSRVGRLSLLQGEVAFRNTATGEALPAVLNWPIATGAALETAPGARAEVHVGSTTFRIDGNSIVEFAAVDDERVQLELIGGAMTVRIRSREQLTDYSVLTPQARITFLDVGRYRLDHGATPDATALTVHEGAARFEHSDGASTVAAGQRAEMAASGFRVVAAAADEFDDWSVARDRRDDSSRSARYTSAEMTGYEDLDEYGEWQEVEEYGPVWVPSVVAADWAPYRAGRWAWIEPWGWTWVDHAPWGFAPFHYGRWAIVKGRWGWVPGPVVARPAYAPALVAWLGRPGWQATQPTGIVPAVGWFPLGPREVFHPSYRCSAQHVRKLNAHASSVALNGEARNGNYQNRHAPGGVTVAPQHVVATGASVAAAALRINNPQDLAALPASHVLPDPSIVPQYRHGGPRRGDRGRVVGFKRDWPGSSTSQRDPSAAGSWQEKWRRGDERSQSTAPRAARIREAQPAEAERVTAPPPAFPRVESARPPTSQRYDGARATRQQYELPRSYGPSQGGSTRSGATQGGSTHGARIGMPGGRAR